MNRKVGLILALIGALTCLLLLGWWWRLVQVQRTVEEVMPVMPVLEDSQLELRRALAAASNRASSLMDSREGLGDLAKLYHANGYVAEALQCYEALAQLEPGEPRWPHLRAVILAGYGDLEPSMELWRRVIELAPDYVPARLRFADSALKSNQPELASELYEDVLRQRSDESYARLGLARIDFEARRWEDAKVRLEQLVEETDYQLGYDLIVDVYERLGMDAKAAAVRRRMKASGAFREAPDPWLDELIDVCYDPYRIATTAGMVTDPNEARRLLLRAIRLDPEEVSYRLQLVGLLNEEGRSVEALKRLHELTKLAPDFADAWARLSSMYWEMGERETAEQVLITGLEHCPDSPSLHLMRGSMLRLAGRYQEAIRELQASIALRANEAEAYIELGQAYMESGNIPRGLTELRRAVGAEPGNPKAIAALAFHAISSQDRREADRWMDQVSRQPRVGEDQARVLRKAYREAFGTDWRTVER